MWALDQFGIRCVIAPSFADIFKNNSFKSGLLPVELPESEVNELFDRIASGESLNLKIDLEDQKVWVSESRSVNFTVDPFRRSCLLQGLDDIGLRSSARRRSRSLRQSIERPSHGCLTR